MITKNQIVCISTVNFCWLFFRENRQRHFDIEIDIERVEDKSTTETHKSGRPHRLHNRIDVVVQEREMAGFRKVATEKAVSEREKLCVSQSDRQTDLLE